MNFQNEIDQLTKSFTEKFGNLTAEQLNWKPNAETWSIAQVIDHLIVINKTYFPIITAVRNGTYRLPFLARFSFITNFFGNFILNSVEPERKRKMKTFPIWQPQASTISGNIVSEFAKHQEELKKSITDCADLVAKGQVISSPANNIIVYKLEKAFEIIITHEKRHFN